MITWILIFVILHAIQISFCIVLFREFSKYKRKLQDEISIINRTMKFNNR